MRNRILPLIAVLAMTSVALCDDVSLGKASYGSSKVTGATNGEVFFTAATKALHYPSTEVTLIQITGQDDFNAAEKFASQEKWPEALKSYDAAASKAQDWMATLVRFRRIKALEAQNLATRAVQDWIDILNQAGKSPSSACLELRPKVTKDAKDAARASDTLKAAIAKMSDKDAIASATELMQELAEAKKPSPKPTPDDPKTNTAVTPAVRGSSPAVPMTGQLAGAANLLKSGQAQKVLDDVRANLNHYTSTDLPSAQYLAGKAQMMLAEKATGPAKTALIAGAGLDFMRVATFSPYSDAAPEALYMAGVACELMGAVDGAQAAFDAVRTRYAENPAAEEAKAGLARLAGSK